MKHIIALIFILILTAILLKHKKLIYGNQKEQKEQIERFDQLETKIDSLEIVIKNKQ